MWGYTSALLPAIGTSFAGRWMLKRIPAGRFFEIFLFGVGRVPIQGINTLILSLIHGVNKRFRLLRDTVEWVHVPYEWLVDVLSN